MSHVMQGDARARLREIASQSVDTVITSPPYFRLRNYQTPGQFGLEPTIEGWVDHLRSVFQELARVIKPTGSVWLNLGDSYSRHEGSGAIPKSLLLGPERLLLALASDGWLVRNKLVWQKSNPMPSSVADRLSCTWEPVYLLVRSRHYFFDLDAIRVPHISPGVVSRAAARRAAKPRPQAPSWAGPLAGSNHGLDHLKGQGRPGHPLGKNPGDVLRTASSNYRGAHFATFPLSLVAPLLQATCPEQVCLTCDRPWERQAVRQLGHLALLGPLRPTCLHRKVTQPGLVLDPFMGAGTVAVAAERQGLRWIGIELNPEFVRLTNDRLVAMRRSKAAA